jgi:hypothetical protein
MTTRAIWAAIGLLLLASCRRPNKVGDHVLVSWRGGDYPAVIIGIEGPSRLRVHYDGFSEDWDEVVPATRVLARLSSAPGPAPPGPAPSHKARSKTSPSSSTAQLPASVYRVGDRVRVEWHGSIYPATIVTVLGDDRYRVHYESFGNEWDEDVGLGRIQRKGN